MKTQLLHSLLFPAVQGEKICIHKSLFLLDFSLAFSGMQTFVLFISYLSLTRIFSELFALFPPTTLQLRFLPSLSLVLVLVLVPHPANRFFFGGMGGVKRKGDWGFLSKEKEVDVSEEKKKKKKKYLPAPSPNSISSPKPK